MAKSAPVGPGVKLAYLTSQYPATSHTFISREVAALRQLGTCVDTVSVRAPSDEEMKDPALAREADRTFTILSQPVTRIIGAHLRALVRRPMRYFQTLGRAMRHRVPGLRPFAMSFVYFVEAVVLADELERRRVTRLHNHFANSGATVGYLAASLLDMPWSFTMHGISETDYPAGLLLGRKIEAADFVACVSYFGRAQAMRVVQPGQWPKLHVVRCAVPLSSTPRHAERTGALRIVCVGRLSAEKGQAGLIQAFASIARERDGLELMFVGDGPERQLLQSLAQALGAADRIRFAGRCGEQETLEHIAGADMLVLPSFMEGLPIVLMEAMAIGTPLIASRVAGIPELVEDGKSGLLFTPSDWDALADCMRRMIDDSSLRTKLARAGRAAVSTLIDSEHSARTMRKLFGAEGG